MANQNESSGGGGGFGLGFFIGGLIGLVAGAYLASGPGRDQVESLRSQTIELTGRARGAVRDPEHPVRRAVQEGVTAARRRRAELESEEPPTKAGPGPVAPTTES
ncbi:MAG TPA: hypothetical protein VF134_07035 [Candidatus Dormibacteraeota bacterium]